VERPRGRGSGTGRHHYQILQGDQKWAKFMGWGASCKNFAGSPDTLAEVCALRSPNGSIFSVFRRRASGRHILAP